jgi:pseudouridine-5'-phosphate glycosidase
MESQPFYHIQITAEISRALAELLPVVALESTVIAHGLPYPHNRILAENMEHRVRSLGVVPATIAILDGCVQIGLTPEEIERLACGIDIHKISTRDIGPAIALGWSGGTTVAATILAAHSAHIRVFATGGIGGVHRQVGFETDHGSLDVSADLPQLACTPIIVVCAGAKAILDLPATLEYLETWAVPVVGYQTDEFPAFYSRESNLKVSVSADSVQEVVKIAKAHWQMGNRSAVVVANPPPMNSAMSYKQMEDAIQQALQDAQYKGVSGQAATPYLLQRVNELTQGASLQANIELLLNNARLGAEIAIDFD